MDFSKLKFNIGDLVQYRCASYYPLTIMARTIIESKDCNNKTYWEYGYWLRGMHRNGTLTGSVFAYEIELEKVSDPEE